MIIINDTFWSEIQNTVRKSTIPLCIQRCKETGRLENFNRVAAGKTGGHQGRFFNDSDVYKVLEGAGHSLHRHPDPQLQEQVMHIISSIIASQEKDGYLNTYYTLDHPNEKWSDMDMHELYCLGHLIEAALALNHENGDPRLMKTAQRAADMAVRLFGEEGQDWVPGHQEIELALFALADYLGEEDYRLLAFRLLSNRGKNKGMGTSWNTPGWGKPYCQDHLPVEEQYDVTGHAVRAMFQYIAMTDEVLTTGNKKYSMALDALWQSVVHRNMYITGGIGPSKENEGFTEDYHLPNSEAYCETCAAIGLFLWAERMSRLHDASCYADIMERTLFNGILSGLSAKGDQFFYVNPLESDGSHHREPWYETSCCPTQLARFLSHIDEFIWSTKKNIVTVNLYISSSGQYGEIGKEGFISLKNTLETNTVHFKINTGNAGSTQFRFRIPSWCHEYQLTDEHGSVQNGRYENGYFITTPLMGSHQFKLVLKKELLMIKSQEQVKENRGKVAFQYGPIMYCFEETDLQNKPTDVMIHSLQNFKIEKRKISQFILPTLTLKTRQYTLYGIPYFSWDNREGGAMAVWLRHHEDMELNASKSLIDGLYDYVAINQDSLEG
ncbi:MAG: glycoside hydrolase family 127 protein [Spirochaetales bacterium]|nr:glycoside hydrolase family 127 protein [Spirochaetales bacterium]